jgi:hypothetical protein
MKISLLLLIMGISQIAFADELIQMSNGMTCWRNKTGFIYGCSGEFSTGDNGFNDVRTGTRYEMASPDNAINTRTGQTINVPSIKQDSDRKRNNVRALDKESDVDKDDNY